MDPEVSEFVNECLEFYKQSGYTKLENFTLGSQSRVFKNLYQDVDDQLLFKNPYDPNNNLKDYEREFLKKVIARLRKINKGVDDITGKS
jgi:signal-transduction protein with cAMP-binding, CBS, and nucleotidyltransferase domain